jgi:hypothetical protein
MHPNRVLPYVEHGTWGDSGRLRSFAVYIKRVVRNVLCVFLPKSEKAEFSLSARFQCQKSMKDVCSDVSCYWMTNDSTPPLHDGWRYKVCTHLLHRPNPLTPANTCGRSGAWGALVSTSTLRQRCVLKHVKHSVSRR